MGTINRYNYEAWMFDYLEENLDNEQKVLFFSFMESNPDLYEELEMMKSAFLIPEKISFDQKHLLLKSNDPIIEMPESDYLLIKQMEEGLTDKEDKRLKEILYNYPALKKDSDSYKLTKLHPKEIIYTKKSSLKRKNYLPQIWTAVGSVAAAAVLLFFILKPVENLTETELIVQSLEQDSSKFKVQSLEQDSSKFKVQSSEQEVQSSKFKIQSSEPEPETLNFEPETRNLEPETLNPKPETLNLEPETLNLKPETDFVAFISKPELQLFPNIEKINVYEIGLSMMIPQYIENQQLMLAYGTRIYDFDYNYEPERGSIIKAGLRLINRLSSRNIVFENYFLSAVTFEETYPSYQ